MFWNGFLINFTFLELHCTKKACVAGFTFPFTPICVFLSGHMIPSFWRHFHRDWCVVWLYFEVAVLVVIFVLAFAWNRLWCCIVVSFSDVNEKVWYAPAVLRFIAVLYFSCCLPGMLSKDAAVKVWPTSAQAVWFLLWIGLLSLPRCCPHGHEWNRFYSNFDGGNVFLHCVAPMILVPDSEDEEEGQRKKLCDRKRTWRQKGTLPYALCRTMRPDHSHSRNWCLTLLTELICCLIRLLASLFFWSLWVAFN